MRKGLVRKSVRMRVCPLVMLRRRVLSDLSEAKWRGMLRLRIRTNRSFAPTPVYGIPIRSITAFTTSGQATVASTSTSAYLPPISGGMNLPQEMPSL